MVRRGLTVAKQGVFSTWKRGWADLPKLPIDHGKHVAPRHLGLLRHALGGPLPQFWPRLLPPEYSRAASEVLALNHKPLAIAPGAGDCSNRGKRWPLKRLMALACQARAEG